MQDQIDALPPAAVPEFDRLRQALETRPWDGAPYLLEDQRRVDLLLVQWGLTPDA
ncbi:hypothetical protein ACQPX6_29835 [Actinomycetospora sp. CA-101289]|uniref:hypothetical protein n=1 Tax=Actinomycetospora sp. CA-101289 TaxID=3239893 RepID=UPI003D966580